MVVNVHNSTFSINSTILHQTWGLWFVGLFELGTTYYCSRSMFFPADLKRSDVDKDIFTILYIKRHFIKSVYLRI